MPIDRFSNSDSVISPALDCFAVAPSDTIPLTEIPKALYIGSQGDLALRLVNSSQSVVFRNLQEGTVLSVRPSLVFATGTTAANIVGLL
jgi:hypothetical protein